MGAGTVDSGVPQVLQKRAVGVLLAPHLGHVKADIVYKTVSLHRQLLELTFEYVWVWSQVVESPGDPFANLDLAMLGPAQVVSGLSC